MGFSIIGLLIAVFIFLPNVLFIIFPPKNVPDGLKDAGIVFTVLERIGQAGCLVLLVMSKENYQDVIINRWFVLMVLCIIAYYCLWIRYVVKGHYFSLAFMPVLLLPIPMAIFPVLAFVFAALWGKSIFLGSAVVLLAIGHFVNSWHTYKFIK
jgi:hypothetical protein